MQTQVLPRNLRQRSASADTIDRTATIHRSSGGHRTRDRPRHQPDAGSYDATGRITYVLAAALACSMLAAMNPVNSSADSAIENFIFGLLYEPPHQAVTTLGVRGCHSTRDEAGSRRDFCPPRILWAAISVRSPLYGQLSARSTARTRYRATAGASV